MYLRKRDWREGRIRKYKWKAQKRFFFGLTRHERYSLTQTLKPTVWRVRKVLESFS